MASDAATLADLVADLTRLSPQSNAQELRKCRDYALKTIKSNQYVRVNHFEVDSELRGLLEKFRILNRDDLAEGLEDQWKAFAEIPNKYAPEILSFLLQLSDNPAASNAFIPAEREEESDAPPLTWDEILRDDPYSDEELWLQVNYSEMSSDSDAASEEETPVKAKAREVVLPIPSISHLNLLEKEEIQHPNQFWKSSSAVSLGNESRVAITELDAIRESIHMLRGLPTTLFHIDQEKVQPVPTYGIKQMSFEIQSSIMSNFAELGTVLNRLRVWESTRQQQPLAQSIRSTVRKKTSEFDRHINAMELNFTDDSANVTTSLIKFDSLIERLDRDEVSCLEILHEECFFRQLASNNEFHQFLASVFLNAFRIYLRPVRLWMEQGELDPSDERFFVVDRKLSSNKDASIWHDQVTIRKPEDDKAAIPKFMNIKISRILNAGKSVRFLKKLGYDTKAFNFAEEPKLDFQEICRYNTELDLFDSRFNDALDAWIESKYKPSSSLLHNILIDDFHLFKNLEALRHVFFVPNGLIFQSVFDPIFKALDTKHDLWNDQYLLQERLRAALKDSTTVEVSKVFVRSTSSKSTLQSIKSMSTINIDYQLPWPLLNVIRKSSTSFYQKIFKFLLQIYRARYLLRQTAFLRHNCQTQNPQNQRIDPMAVALHQELNFFIDVLHTHLVNSVLEPGFDSMLERMKRTSDLDEMTQVHDGYISSLLAQCLLIKNLNPIYNAVISVLDLVVGFAKIQKRQLAVDEESKSSKNSRRRKGRRRALSMKAAEWAKQVLKEEESSSDDDPTERFNDSYDADTEALTEPPANDEEKLAKLHKDYEQLHNFIMTGLRGIARSGGEATWEMLADQLDWAGHTEQSHTN